MNGKEIDFDPDALALNAAYALCGPAGRAALSPHAGDEGKGGGMTTETTKGLLPCPFCGGKAEYICDFHAEGFMEAVSCESCSACVMLAHQDPDNKAHLTAAWNARASQEQNADRNSVGPCACPGSPKVCAYVNGSPACDSAPSTPAQQTPETDAFELEQRTRSGPTRYPDALRKMRKFERQRNLAHGRIAELEKERDDANWKAEHRLAMFEQRKDLIRSLQVAAASADNRAESAESQLAALAEKAKALGNCYTMALRELRKDRSNEAWGHIKRFCEEAGTRQQLLRDALPTEITDGAALFAWADKQLPKGVLRQDSCVWVQDSDGPWNSSCGVTYEFIADGPEENKAHFCHHCGGVLMAEPYEKDAALSQRDGSKKKREG